VAEADPVNLRPGGHKEAAIEGQYPWREHGNHVATAEIRDGGLQANYDSRHMRQLYDRRVNRGVRKFHEAEIGRI
jgi:hypothetical protein